MQSGIEAMIGNCGLMPINVRKGAFQKRMVIRSLSTAYAGPADHEVEDFIVLYRTFDWLDLKTGHLIGWILKCWNLLFKFCHLIGFHCLCGPGFNKRTLTVLTDYSHLSILSLHMIFDL